MTRDQRCPTLERAYRHVILPTYETLLHGRKNFRYWKDLDRSQYLSAHEVGAIQLRNLQRLIVHAFEHCPHYRQTWESMGLSPGLLKTTNDIRRWPLTAREDIVQHRLRMRAQVPGMRFISKATSGSTGSPLRIDYDTASEERRYAAWYRGYSWAGAAPGTKQLWLWAKPLARPPLLKRWKEELYAAIYRRRIMNTFELDEKRVPVFAAIHDRYKPDVLIAYTNPMYTFARELEQRGIKPYSPKSIVVGAEKLYDFQRTVIERVFGCPVFETYGSREFMLMAAECDRHEGLHLTAEHLLVEVLNDDGTPTRDGQEGNLVITDLFNYGMPMIRYRNNDRAVAGWRQCSCGRGLPLMQPPTGRTLDMLTTSDGRRVPGEVIPYLLKDYASLKRYQVIQDAPDHIEVRLVTTAGWDQGQRREVEKGLRLAMGPTVRFDIISVEDIPVSNSGKFQVVVNKVAQQAARIA